MYKLTFQRFEGDCELSTNSCVPLLYVLFLALWPVDLLCDMLLKPDLRCVGQWASGLIEMKQSSRKWYVTVFDQDHVTSKMDSGREDRHCEKAKRSRFTLRGLLLRCQEL